MKTFIEIRKNEFRDSVILMNVSRKLQDEQGVVDALVVMGSDSNKEILSEMGLLTDEAITSTANDMVVAVKVEKESVWIEIQDNFETYFESDRIQSEDSTSYPTIQSAIDENPDVNLALISVPGEYASIPTRQTIKKGLNTLLFSDNVPLEEEKTLKQFAEEQGVLLMGPDCGVCNIDGAALALASICEPGPVGIIGASGSGVQEIAAILNRQGIGISQIIGTGGRDLKEEIGALTMLSGLSTLEKDAATSVIVLVGKDPGKSVKKKIISKSESTTKPIIACFLGGKEIEWQDSKIIFTPNMDAAAQCVRSFIFSETLDYKAFDETDEVIASIINKMRKKLRPEQKYLRGLFGGGTFVSQAQLILNGLLSGVYSNSPFGGGEKLPNSGVSLQHSLIDLGDEEFTQGRAHPVIDPLPYRLRISKEFQDPQTAVIVFDVILGPATHPDPAGYIIDAINKARNETGKDVCLIASVCGTEKDPQCASTQMQKLKDADVIVMPTSAQAILLAGLILSDIDIEEYLSETLSTHEVISKHKIAFNNKRDLKGTSSILSGDHVSILNIGIDSMADALSKQSVEVIQIDWKIPCGGDLSSVKLLGRIEEDEDNIKQKIEKANNQAYDIFVSGQPIWKDVRPAGEVIPGFHKHLITHSGPPIDVDHMQPMHRDGVLGAVQYEGLARSPEEALLLIQKGEIELAPCQEYGVPTGGMAAVSYSMPVNVAEDIEHHTLAFSPIQEGPSYEALRWGVYNNVVAKRWKWFNDVFAPALSDSLQMAGGINLRNIIAKSLMMGDENHSRETGSSLLLEAELAPYLAKLKLPEGELSRIFEFLLSADRFALHVMIAGSSSVLHAAENIEYCTVVTGMGGNGVEMGIRISCHGSQFFTAPAPIIQGRYLNPNTKPEDTVPFSGDSCAVTVYGLGGLAAAASPSVTLLGGGRVEDAINRTKEMFNITVGKNPNYTIPTLNFEGTPTCIDMMKVLNTGIVPQSHAGIIHKNGGQAGAGVAHVPMECFTQALSGFIKKYGMNE